MPDIVVPLESRRRVMALLAQKIQHVLPSVFLLGNGFLHLDHADMWVRTFGILEIATSTIVIVLFLRELRGVRRGAHHAHHGHAVDWLDIGLAAMVFVEAASHHQETNHWPRPTLLLGATMLLLGLTHGRVMAFSRRRRSLRIDGFGISRGLKFFRSFKLAWDQIAEIRMGGTRAVIASKDGAEHAIDLADLDNADRVRDALKEADRRWKALKS